MSCNPFHKATVGCKCNPPTKKRKTAAFYFLIALFGAILLVAFNAVSGYEEQALNVQNLGMVLVLGFLTGLHCIGMCGGFMMSYIRYAKERQMTEFEMHAKYGVSKIISYATFGAIAGLLGSIIHISNDLKSIVSLLGGGVLLMLGAKALGVFSKFKKIAFTRRITKKSSAIANPIYVGLLKGLMVSCAPLQALYLISAGIGDPFKGALMLAVFGIGTLPIFLFYGVFLGTLRTIKTKAADIITASIIIVFGVMMVNRGLNLGGHDFKNMAFYTPSKTVELYAVDRFEGEYQVIPMQADSKGWSAKQLSFTYGQKIRWEIYASEITMCNKTIHIPALEITQELHKGLNVIEFDPRTHKNIVYTCWMGMLNGTFTAQ